MSSHICTSPFEKEQNRNFGIGPFPDLPLFERERVEHLLAFKRACLNMFDKSGVINKGSKISLFRLHLEYIIRNGCHFLLSVNLL